jgi:hypothetical protein
MLRTLRRRSSPALVVAIIALVAATAGTATAATKVLIKSSAQVRKGALDASDLSAKARQSLRGNRGPAGPAGPAGPVGATGAAGPAGERGPSEVFAARASTINVGSCPVAGCDPGAILRTLALPAGSFLVTSSAELAPTTFVADASRNVECHLERADDGAFQRAHHLYRAAGVGGGVDDQTVEVSWALTLPAPTTLSLSCSMGSVKFSAANARITAMQVGSLTETVS